MFLACMVSRTADSNAISSRLVEAAISARNRRSTYPVATPKSYVGSAGRILQQDICTALLDGIYENTYERSQDPCSCSISNNIATLDCDDYDYCMECVIENGQEICGSQRNTFSFLINEDANSLNTRQFCIDFSAGGLGSAVCYSEAVTGPSAVNFTCSLTVGGKECTACAPSQCADGRVDVTLDCTNLLGGGVTDRCKLELTDSGMNPISRFAGNFTFATCTVAPSSIGVVPAISPTETDSPTIRPTSSSSEKSPFPTLEVFSTDTPTVRSKFESPVLSPLATPTYLPSDTPISSPMSVPVSSESSSIPTVRPTQSSSSTRKLEALSAILLLLQFFLGG